MGPEIRILGLLGFLGARVAIIIGHSLGSTLLTIG